ncbi:NADH-ubiquinone oxidoreductase chain [Rhynchospora pubera]|uniref:NADH-ubiquinone oxidoreductase chain n=1 Tax=Rhynchospora pubera TaxID=906938 RepID=A0AAV8EEW7_9POAL|nr:NADH-ubiquinone oxidoreductase chain [Rhynchospora pubera]
MIWRPQFASPPSRNKTTKHSVEVGTFFLETKNLSNLLLRQIQPNSKPHFSKFSPPSHFPHLFSIQPCNFYLDFMRMKAGSKMAEQLKQYGYQIRSKHDWIRAPSFPSASPSSSSSRGEVLLVILEILMFTFLIFSGVSLYFKHMRLAFLFICITGIILVCARIAKQIRQDREWKRRMLLPLSM